MKNTLQNRALFAAIAAILASQSIALAQEEPSAQFEQGCKLMQAKRFNDAVAMLTEAISVAPKDAMPMFRRGQCFFCLGKYSDAIADFDRAIAIDKEVGTFYIWRGTAAAKDGKDTQALNDYLRAMRLNPSLVINYTENKGKGETTPALQNAGVLAQAIERKRVADSTVNVGRSDRALEIYAEAVKKAAIKASAYFCPGTVFSGVFEVGPDGNLLGCRLESKTDGTVSKKDGGDYFALDGNEKGVAEIDDKIQAQPNNADLYYQKGRLLQQLSWVEMALNSFDRAIELDNSNVRYRLARAFLYHSMQKDELADKDIKIAVDLDPELPSTITFAAPKTKTE